jgi:hypothetical protein
MAVLICLPACQEDPAADRSASATEPTVTAEVVQLRRDQVLQRVEVAVRNAGDAELFVERLRLRVAGFDLPGALRKDEPVLAGQVVNLPVPFSGVSCPADEPPQIGPPRVSLEVRYGDDPRSRSVRLTADDSDGLLLRIATRACAVERVLRDVDLRFSDDWRFERAPGRDVLHGVLVARLRRGGERMITQVDGAIMYGLRPDASAGAVPAPLAALTPERPEARIPVMSYAARCTAHTIGEIKKPYEFLVWVSTPDGEELAVTPTVGDRTKAALRRVCAF